MVLFDFVRGRDASQATHVLADAAAGATAPDEKKSGSIEVGAKPAAAAEDVSDSELSIPEKEEREVIANGNNVTSDAQLGVQKAEAAALVWTKKTLYITYAWIWVCFFMLAFQQSIFSNVTFYAYADFAAAPQISTAFTLSSIIGGVLRLPIAKILNLWGRAEGFAISIVVYIISLIVVATCNGPNGYAAGYVLYWISYTAIYFIMDVFVADTSGLRNRAWAFAFVSTPFICTAFTGPLATQAFLQTTTWRWAIGAFAIIMPFVFSPLVVVFKLFQIKAEKQGLFKRVPSGRTVWQSVVHYFYEFDIIGAAILMAAFVLFLLPFSLQSYGHTGYSSPAFIVMVVLGVLLFPTFYVYERYFAVTHFVRWELFRSRTVLGACILAATLFFSYYSWDMYFLYFVQVVYDLDVADSGYMLQIYNIGSCFWGVVFGLYIRKTRHFKYACLFFGLPLLVLGAGLMIHFRGDDQPIGYLVMCQIFIAFAGGTLVIGEDMAVMSAADHDGVPLMLALLQLSSNLGGSIGNAVTVAIYTNTFPNELQRLLPPESAADWNTIYLGGSTTQITYPVGSATRDAINSAWGYTQKYNCIAATAILILGFPAIAMWKNYNVDRKQNKGTMI